MDSIVYVLTPGREYQTNIPYWVGVFDSKEAAQFAARNSTENLYYRHEILGDSLKADRKVYIVEGQYFQQAKLYLIFHSIWADKAKAESVAEEATTQAVARGSAAYPILNHAVIELEMNHVYSSGLER